MAESNPTANADYQDRIRDRVDEWLSGFMHKLRVGKEWSQDERRMQVPTLASVGGGWTSFRSVF